MKVLRLSVVIGVFLTVLAVVPVISQDADELTGNITEGCVTDFDPTVDYFPEKVEITDAQNFSVDYFNNYKLVTVQTSLGEAVDYVLVQCGTPMPEDLPDSAAIIEVPTGDIVTLTTTQLVHLVELDLLDNLIGMDTFLFVNSPEVRERIDAGELTEVAANFELNVEVLLDLAPALVMSDDFDPDRLAVLQQNAQAVALNTDYLEPSPLGYSEWVKYTALFYNAEAAANAVYDDIVESYELIRDLAADVPEDERPVVLWNSLSTFSNAWSIPGADTYAGQFIRDAGGIIALEDLATEGSALLSFETVYDGALDADIWIANLFAVNTLDDVLAIDERYADFAAFQNGDVWNNDLDVNENGGSNYFERGVTNPQLILADLVAIFHPDLLPEHTFNFYRTIPMSE